MAWRYLRGAAAMIFLGALGLAPPAGAQAGARPFDIPAGPASAAIDEFARQADVNVLAAGELLAGQRTGGLRGSYGLAEALARLLAGTGLSATVSPGGSVFIERSPEARSDPEPLTVVPDVIVLGTRAAQQSSIIEKRFAPTAIDVVVAQDVGSFPDRNVAEAISRVAGVALDRGDYGEGITVGLRGIGADMTRVEIDGLGVAGAGGAALTGPDDRSVEFRELPSDMIKSVEIVKGATAADTEGGLAGSILIHTRTGFDFKERYVSGRLSGNRNSIDKRWGPDRNLVYADRFLGGRLGVLATVNRSRSYNEHHRQELSVNGGSGPTLQWDFDGSPRKTFSFNPATVSRSDPAADARPATSPYALTPRELVTVAAGAPSKAACRAALPALTAAQLNALPQSRRQAAVTQRNNELATCLNQWNDYTPTLVRSAIRRQDDKRRSSDIRFDYKVNDNLALFAKGTRQDRLVWETWMTHSLGNIGANNVDPATVVVDGTHHVVQATIADGAVYTDKQLDRIETKNTYLQLGGSWRAGRFRSEFFVGHVASDFQREARRLALGFGYGPVTMRRLPGGLWAYELPSGRTYDLSDYTAYSPVAAQPARAAVAATVNSPAAPAYTAAQLPLAGAGFSTAYTPTAAETRELTARFDAAYALAGLVPFAGKLRFGAQRRDYDNRFWNHVGYQVSGATGTYGQPGYVAPVVVPSPRLRESGLYPCQDTAGSLGAGGLPCAYGYTPSTALASPRDGRTAVTPQQFAAIVGQVMAARTAPLFSGARDRLAGQVDGWNDIDVLQAFALAGIRNDDPGCLKRCTANDGKVYAQPVNALSEKVDAAYLMAEFSTGESLPYGVRVEGNAGVRAVRTRVRGTGLLTITAITKTPAFNPANPALAQGVASTSVTSLASLDRRYMDYLPSFNAAAWLVPDRLALRYGWAKMIGRPKVSQMVPNGTCTYDERQADLGEAMQCTTTVGNPALKPWSSKNHHLGLEYYPDDDTMLTLAHFRHHGARGAPRQATLTDQQLFQGSGVTDPATGQALDGYRFSVPTLVNGEGVSRSGWEVAVKSAMPKLPAFLPAHLLAFLRHTGIDLNVSRSRPRNDGAQYRDLNSGAVLPPVFEPRRTVNLSLWYDDGAFSARIAAQAVGERLLCIAPCGGNGPAQNYPADGATRVMLPYVPGLPVFGRETRYLDARVAYRFGNGVELFADVRNLGKTWLRTDTGNYAVHEDGGSNVLGIGYGGVRVAAGLTFRY
ncbi:TonB-dependent receptor [Massilia sp. METH4]|uniref:TonB-dependent receptor n=1 Tax=Massilia sp. METH4 TaxID=3123041 RepID=UPI0030CD36CA